jgi:hypothetical protein
MIDLISMLIFATFPFAYARYSRVKNLLLFVLASFGFVGLVSALGTLALIPGAILGIYVFPGVEDYGIDLSWYGSMMDVIVEPVYAIFCAVLGIVGPILVLRRYPAFFVDAAQMASKVDDGL